VRCLELKSYIFQFRGDLIPATKALEEGLSIVRALDQSPQEALLNQSLAGVLLLKGKVTEAASLSFSAQQYYEANDDYPHLIDTLVFQSYTSISQKDFINAQLPLDRAMEIDQLHNKRRERLNILYWKASGEGWAGNITAALKILQEATKMEVVSATSQFDDYSTAIQGRAYYEARIGRFDDARSSISHAIELRKESGEDFVGYFLSALIANISGQREEAMSIIQKLLEQYGGENRQLMAIGHRTLGELMWLEGKELQGREQFAQAKAICDETGISPKHLYANKTHWFSLPLECGGDRFLDDFLC